ncbi:MAG TPA: hypothetical protein VFA75_04210 [Nevskia sp.]|nr:hypothetical protein [Nevskia sp.]
MARYLKAQQRLIEQALRAAAPGAAKRKPRRSAGNGRRTGRSR